MLIYDGDSDVQLEIEKEEPPSYLPSVHTADLTDSGDSEKYPEVVLVREEDNAVQYAKSKVGRVLHRITEQFSRWGFEVNGSVNAIITSIRATHQQRYWTELILHRLINVQTSVCISSSSSGSRQTRTS